ncbi:MAG: 2,3-bisphosphoglycerate-independent phosphoglycerate mutase [Candidatus Nealsonbacteria bacterium]
MKILFIIIDGLGDRPIKKLNNKTPLESASTPNLDYLAKNGICGLVLPFLFPWEKEPTSEGTHVALFGYKDYFLGRGAYEAAGVGMPMNKKDIAFRVNFGTVDKNLKIIDRRAGRIDKTQPLVESLNEKVIDGIKFLLKKSSGHRAVLILKGKNLSEKISDGDPHKEGLKVKKILPLNKSKSAQKTAEVLNKFLTTAHLILKNHPFNKKRIKRKLLPANYLLVRGAGKLRKVPSFKKRYDLKTVCVAAGTLYKGVAKIIGMDEIFVKGATGFANTNLGGKILAAKKAFKKYNFVFLHIKATDTFAHDGDFLGKKKFIEKIDKNIKSLLNLKNALIVVTADHSTCSLLKRHCKIPIPILIYGVGRDSVSKFSEKDCKRGKLGKIKQIDLMSKIMELMEKSK